MQGGLCNCHIRRCLKNTSFNFFLCFWYVLFECKSRWGTLWQAQGYVRNWNSLAELVQHFLLQFVCFSLSPQCFINCFIFFVGMCLFPSICVEDEATRKELIAAWPRGTLRKRGSLKTKHQAANTLSISTRPPASFIIASRAHFSQCWGEEWNRRKTKNNKRMEMKPIRSNGRKTCYVQLIHEIQ